MSAKSSSNNCSRNLVGKELTDWINNSTDFPIEEAHLINQTSWSGTGDNTYHFDRFQFTQPTDGIKQFFKSYKCSIEGPLLDIACAGGHNLAYFASKGIAPLYGIDISKPYIEQAQKMVPDAHLRIADMLKIPLEDNFFSTILARGIFHNTTTKGFVMGLIETYRLLKNDGILYIRRRYQPNNYDKSRNTALFTYLEYDNDSSNREIPSMVRNFMPVPQITSLIKSVGFRLLGDQEARVISHINQEGKTRYVVEYVCTK